MPSIEFEIMNVTCNMTISKFWVTTRTCGMGDIECGMSSRQCLMIDSG